MQQLLTMPAQLGAILRGRRKALRIPQRELAEKLGVSQNRLSALETNPERMTLDRLMTAATLLGLELVVRDRTAKPTTPEW